jgi:hypothetical protein
MINENIKINVRLIENPITIKMNNFVLVNSLLE